MSTKVLLIGARLCRNLGGPSLLVTTKRVLNEFLPNAEYTFISPTVDDLPLSQVYDVKIIPKRNKSFLRALPAFLAKAITGISFGSKGTRELCDAFSKADTVIDIWGIIFCGSLTANSYLDRLAQGLHLILAKIFRKPVVKYTADIGPFDSTWNKFFAKLYMQHFVDLILARNDVTQERLSDLRVATPVIVCPDTAFLLEPHESTFAQSISREKTDHPIVGFSISHQAAKQSGDSDRYLSNMAELADYIVDGINAKILLIPNELSVTPLNDDAFTAHEIRKRMSKQHETIMFSNDYNAPETKGIIAQCDVLVGSRYHSIVAAISLSIPVLAIGWHNKYPEVLRLVGQEKHICAVASLNLDDLQNKFDTLWRDRDQIRNEINAVLPLIRENIFRGGKEVSLLLKKRKEEPGSQKLGG